MRTATHITYLVRAVTLRVCPVSLVGEVGHHRTYDQQARPDARQGPVQADMPQSPDSGTAIAQGESMRRAARKPFRYDAAAFSTISDSSPDWYISMSRSHPPTNSPSM